MKLVFRFLPPTMVFHQKFPFSAIVPPIEIFVPPPLVLPPPEIFVPHLVGGGGTNFETELSPPLSEMLWEIICYSSKVKLKILSTNLFISLKKLKPFMMIISVFVFL